MRIVILTGSELRHKFFRTVMAAAKGVEVLQSYCEGLENTVHTIVEGRTENSEDSELERRHLAARERSEHDFFGLVANIMPDRSNPVFIPRGTVSEQAEAIKALQPDLLIAYGCSLVREPLLSWFQGRFLNVHLGLSPWYRGSGTNFWPLVNGEPEYVGATFMHIDAGVDTGEIVHQIRARVFPGDDPHKIGNRLIGDMALTYIELVRNFNRFQHQAQPQLQPGSTDHVYRRRDFSAAATRKLLQQFKDGLVDRYLLEYESRCGKVPLVRQPWLEPTI